MSDSIYDKDTFIYELTSNYMDMLFYFCLKKTGDRYEAENLAADIVLNVLSSHDRWPAKSSFSAWFWQIARNRYSVWARKKDEHRKFISELDISEYDIADEESITEELVLQKENLELLRRELAFISSSYRKILVAYYIEDKSVKEIAATLGTSESAVKVSLFRARNALKEGMNMARKFGIRSYKPGEVEFNCVGKNSKLLYGCISRLLPQNILLEAYENPSTVEEIAIALGIAVPYLEEEINILTEKGLLRKSGDKYFTDFFIAGKESQNEIYNIQNRNIREITSDIDTIVSDLIFDIRKLGMVTEKLKDSDFKWLCVLYTVDVLGNFRELNVPDALNIISSEKTNISELRVGYRLFLTNEFSFSKYILNDYGFAENKLDMFTGMAELFMCMLRDKCDVSSLSISEKVFWDNFINNVFAYVAEDGTVVPKVFTVTEENRNKIDEMIKAHSLAEKVASVFAEMTEKATKIFEKDCPTDLRCNCKLYALSQMRRIHTMLINEEVERGRLIVPEDPATSTASCYFMMKDKHNTGG